MPQSGMRPSWVGIIMVTMIASSRALLPRNFSLAKANPASEPESTTDTVTTEETMIEFIRPVRKLASSLSSTRPKLSPNAPPGVNGGGTSLIASRLRVAMTNM